jgi:UDP-GlcNAc:undecaprenyl-phosphate/decaprenyl-phosphate GlcNAc-1-phosphate transferase
VGSLAMAFSGIPSGYAYAAGATVLLSYTGWQASRASRQAKE